MNLFLGWQEAFEAGPSVCGGKGYNLARLARYGFRVPRGGVLPAGAPLEAIPPGLQRAGLQDGTLAVRSSATGEDSARASFAGIHRSFLNVRGAAAIREAAQGCLDSLDTAQARTYRQRMGFGDDEVRCAIVLCEMVPARAAGVAFSCDPASGRRDLILIDAAKGLGEDMVSGRVNPLRFAWRTHSGLISREPSSPDCAWFPRSAEEELVAQVRRIHWALGEGQDPQDIEWAWDGSHIWILQARPVTNLPRPGWPETAVLPRYWSTGNIKDAVPGVVSEMAWSAAVELIPDIVFAAGNEGGYRVPEGLEVVRRFQGRGFFDLTLVQWAIYDAFGVPPKEVVRTIGGYQPEIPVPADPFRGPAGRRRQRASLRLLRTLWNYPAKSREASQRHLDYHRTVYEQDWSGRSPAELTEQLAQITRVGMDFLQVAGLANSCSGPWQKGLDALVSDRALIGRLQAGAGGVASAEQGYRIYEIASGKATVDDFLREFGHRAVYEADILNPRWAEDSGWVREQVEAVRRNPPVTDAREHARQVREIAEKEVRRRYPLKAPLILWLARKMREAMSAREFAKSALVSPVLPVRRIVLEIGRRLVAAGHLDAPEQVFHLTHHDLACWLWGYWDGAGARELAGDRAGRRQQWLSETAPDLITEEPDGRVIVAAPVAVAASGVAGWSGIGVAAGQASGRACIVLHPEDAGHLQPGDVLVAPSTDPGWTPLFLRASGIVMETGGFLSHGAIVAREYGIPAVANIPGILSAVKDGERVTVDGSSGRVWKA